MSVRSVRTVTDCHAHIWGDGSVPYPFGSLDGLAPPESPATAETLLADMAAERVTSVVLIQPRIYGYDHAYLYEAARNLGGQARVIPLLNVARRTSVHEIRRLAADPHTAAARVIALGERPADWLLSQEADRVWTAAAELDLPIGFLIDPPQLALTARLAERHPQLTIVVDHMGRCLASQLPNAAGDLLRLAAYPNVVVKLSAIGALSCENAPYRDMWGLVARLFETFGPARLCWGSDWPHARDYGSYGTCLEATRLALRGASEADLHEVFGGTAARIFGLAGASGDHQP